MEHHARQLRQIRELCDLLARAIDASFMVREHGEELKRAAEQLVESTPPERRAMPRVKNALGQRSSLSLLV